MLTGINPLLNGDLLRVLDHMGHNDVILIADAHYPSYGMGVPVLEVASTTPEVVAAVRSVFPIDYYAEASVTLMNPEPGVGEEVQAQLRDAVNTSLDERVEWIDRFDFYERGSEVFAVIRTAETRKYGCIMLRKGVVGDPEQ